METQIYEAMKRLLIALALLAGLAVPPAGLFATPASEVAGAVVEPSVKVLHHAIEIHNPTSQSLRFYIYSITGQMIKELTVDQSETATVELPAGCYIVRSDAGTRKVVVR